MRVLIIEDQENLALLIKKGIEAEGYAADYVTDGEAGQNRIEFYHNDYDVIVLDLMLPKKDGFEICRNMRQKNIKTPVLVLTARDSSDDKIIMMDECGADDYMVKPFNFRELLARLRALTRRPPVVVPTEIKVADLVLNPALKTLHKAGKEIKLTLTEFRLLEYLMLNANQIVERETLTNKIWDFNFDSFSNIVDVYINRLRKKVDGQRGRKILITVRGLGYKIQSDN